MSNLAIDNLIKQAINVDVSTVEDFKVDYVSYTLTKVIDGKPTTVSVHVSSEALASTEPTYVADTIIAQAKKEFAKVRDADKRKASVKEKLNTGELGSLVSELVKSK